MVAGKPLIVVDDSIVRGNTQRALVRMLREAGAVEVHVRIASPPVRWPCFYGIDFASRAELIANGLDVDGVRASINADSLGYVSEQGLIAATEQPRERLCTACFTGTYPIELPTEDRLGKGVLELELTVGQAAADHHGGGHADELGVLELHARGDLGAVVEKHLALVGHEHAGHAVQQGRFAGARGPHDGHGFAVAHRQADAFEDPLLGE